MNILEKPLSEGKSLSLFIKLIYQPAHKPLKEIYPVILNLIFNSSFKMSLNLKKKKKVNLIAHRFRNVLTKKKSYDFTVYILN